MHFESQRLRREGRAFTLLEMLFVFILIGLLAGLVTVNARTYLVKGKQNAARAEISSICTAIETFNTAFNRYPTNEEGLAVLSQKSEKFPEPLLKQVPVDPWGHAYQYNTPGKREPYEVTSFGADGRPGGAGADSDISSVNLKESTK
jgi:general secretion pathway protein G